MSNLYIEEYECILIDPATGVLVPMIDRFVSAQSTDLGATSSTPAQTLPQTHFVVFTANADCGFAIGASPDATASMRYLPAGQTRFFKNFSGERASAVVAEQ